MNSSPLPPDPVPSLDACDVRLCLVLGSDIHGRDLVLAGRAAAAVRAAQGVVFVDASPSGRSLRTLAAACREADRMDDLMTVDLPDAGGSVSPDPLADADASVVEDELLAAVAASGEAVDAACRELARVASRMAAWAAEEGSLARGVVAVRDCLELERLARTAAREPPVRDAGFELPPPVPPQILVQRASAYLSRLPGFHLAKRDMQSQATLDAHARAAAPLLRATLALADGCGLALGLRRGTLEPEEVLRSQRVLHVRLDPLRMSPADMAPVLAALLARFRAASRRVGPVPTFLCVDRADLCAFPGVWRVADLAAAGMSVALGAESPSSLRAVAGEFAAEAAFAAFPSMVLAGPQADARSASMLATLGGVTVGEAGSILKDLRDGWCVRASGGGTSRFQVPTEVPPPAVAPTGGRLFRISLPEVGTAPRFGGLKVVERLCDPMLDVELEHAACAQIGLVPEQAAEGDPLALYVSRFAEAPRGVHPVERAAGAMGALWGSARRAGPGSHGGTR
jgi:hypothetical protein